MDRQDHFRRLERMYASAPINRFFRPTLVVGEGHAEIVVGVDERLFHAAHAVHGSVYFKVLDDAAFFSVASLVEDVFVLTVSFQVFLERPVSGGELRSAGRVLSRTGRLFVAESIVRDIDGQEVGRGSGMFTRSKMALDESVGYV